MRRHPAVDIVTVKSRPRSGSAEPATRDVFARLGVAMVRRRRTVIVVWLLGATIGLALLPSLLGSLASPRYEVTGSESARAAEVLGRGLPPLGNEAALLVFRSERLTVRDPGYRTAVDAGVTTLRRQPGVSMVMRLPLAGDTAPAPMLAEALEPLRNLYRDEHNAYAVVGLTGDDRQRQHQAAAQRAAANDAATRASGGAVSAYLVGVAPFSYEVQRAEIADLAIIEAVALPLAVVVLLLGLRAPLPALLPIAMAGTAVLTTLGLFALFSALFIPDGMLLIGVTAIGFGAGIDYALFIVGRYREEIAHGASREQAAARALATTGRTACYSGLVVILAFTSLFLVRWPVFAQIALGGALVVVAAMAASLTLLPAALAAVTPRLEWAPLRWRRPAASGSQARSARWTRHLMRHPWPYAVVVIVVLLVPAASVADLRLGIGLERDALADTPPGIGLSVLEAEGDGAAGLGGPATVLVQRPAGTSAPEMGPLLAALRADPLVATTTSIDNGDDLTALMVILRTPNDSPAVIDFVHRVREQVVPQTAPPDHPVLVGGGPAVVTDIVDECAQKLWWVIAMMLALLAVVLVLTLRSLLLPVKAIMMNLLVTAAALGIVVVLFQRGIAETVFGFTSTGVLWAHIPILTIVVLFAVSMDYELFLIRRIQEDYLAGGDNTQAVASGLQHNARPLSLAAMIMVVTFGSLLTSQIAGVKVFGFGIAVAIAVDATLIRLVLVPALMQILGRWNWWLPGTRPRSGRVVRRRHEHRKNVV